LIAISLPDILARGAHDLLTLYMMLILLRWVSPWLELDVQSPRLRWICTLTDPLINALRRALPPMGPMDFGPLAAVFVVWVVRALSVGLLASVLAGAATRV